MKKHSSNHLFNIEKQAHRLGCAKGLCGLALMALCADVAAKSTYDLAYKGYFRMGAAFTDSGDAQTNFRAPGAGATYRLGNEHDSFIRLGVDYKHTLPDAAKKDASIEGRILAVDWAKMEDSFSLGLDGIREASLRFNNFTSPGVTYAIGRMEYQRKGIHMMDYWWLNTAQGAHVGATMENCAIGSGMLNLAFLRYEDKTTQTIDSSSVTSTINASGLDIRYQGLALNDNNKISFWGFLGARHKNEDLQLDSESGSGLAVWVDTKRDNGTNTVSLAYKSGSAITKHDGNATPLSEFDGYDLGESSVVELTNNYLIESDKFAMQWGLVLKQTDTGVVGEEGSNIDWYSTGVRPIYYLSDHVNLALELGYDRVNNEVEDYSGSLFKTTLALQLAKGRGYYSRPVLRAFVTRAQWSDDFAGKVAKGSPYEDDTSGWSAGFQLEAWW